MKQQASALWSSVMHYVCTFQGRNSSSQAIMSAYPKASPTVRLRFTLVLMVLLSLGASWSSFRVTRHVDIVPNAIVMTPTTKLVDNESIKASIQEQVARQIQQGDSDEPVVIPRTPKKRRGGGLRNDYYASTTASQPPTTQSHKRQDPPESVVAAKQLLAQLQHQIEETKDQQQSTDRQRQTKQPPASVLAAKQLLAELQQQVEQVQREQKQLLQPQTRRKTTEEQALDAMKAAEGMEVPEEDEEVQDDAEDSVEHAQEE